MMTRTRVIDLISILCTKYRQREIRDKSKGDRLYKYSATRSIDSERSQIKCIWQHLHIVEGMLCRLDK